MHVAFGRVRRKSRIVADYTDDADYGIGDGVGGRELSEAGFVGFSGLGVKSRESEFPPTEEEKIASGTRSYLYLSLFFY